ncbi:hypothetical protein TNCV_3192731 [Trichonephila clavipes]|nr:hypothetical protein TNCV_3192731 [Trichonephila clavipes]
MLMKVTLLSFKVDSSLNYAPLRSVILVQEILQEVFWNAVQKPRHVSLDIKNIVKSLSFQNEFETWEQEEVWRIEICRNQRTKQALCKTSLTRNTNNVQLNNGGGKLPTPADMHVQRFVSPGYQIGRSNFIHRTLLPEVVYAKMFLTLETVLSGVT